MVKMMNDKGKAIRLSKIFFNRRTCHQGYLFNMFLAFDYNGYDYDISICPQMLIPYDLLTQIHHRYK